MDLHFTDDQRALRDLARQIFAGHCTAERLAEVEAGDDRFDRVLWDELGRSNLLGAGLPEGDGGIGGGMIEIALVLEEAGRAVAPVPLGSALVGAWALGAAEQVRAFIAGGAPIVLGLMEPNADAPHAVDTLASEGPNGWTVRGTKTMVEHAADAACIAVSARVGDEVRLFALDPSDAEIERQQPTGSAPTYQVRMDDAPVTPVDAPAASVIEHAVIAVCAEQLGVAERALELTAAYTAEREQFGKKLGTFQAVQQRAADAYIDVQAMRWTMWEAAWRLDAGLDAAEHVATAKVWAAEGGARVLAAAQHLHGGMGVDMDYPLHRYTYAARQLELRLGGANAHLERLAGMIR